ncbi:methyltransferase (plasmid) [Dermacoccus nishinomiyaensis]|uniref:Methyltransferase n=1 Tax=Dermacoccus nishinomiyaensis TaxID=1274 RepID=A0A075JKL7_9MICO|nr:methyltransferase [Dermacoccus nishinomiyaensis]
MCGEATADYDEFASAYVEENESGLFNNWYERPEVLRLAGDVAGLRVLDAGCGHGPLTKELRDRGATVSGFDLSPAMIAIARERLGQDADMRVADLAAPLSYEDDAFDLITCSLALHYVEDWSPTLGELRRVLRPGGKLIVSLVHPFLFAALHRDQDYFALVQYSEDYEFGETAAVMTYWHRPLQDVLNAFIEAGFTFTRLTEPKVHPDTPTKLLPPGEQRQFLSFLFLVFQLPS